MKFRSFARLDLGGRPFGRDKHEIEIMTAEGCDLITIDIPVSTDNEYTPDIYWKKIPGGWRLFVE